MSRFEKTFLEDLLAKVDLPSFIGQYMPALKRISADNFEAICPFHTEKSGSFTVSEKKAFYHCFGCGVHGNAFGFVMEHQGLKFPDAVKIVAEFVGVPLPTEQRPERTMEEKKDAARYMKACAALELAQSIYAKCLVENVDAQSYLMERGVTQSSIELYGLGFAPDAWGTITRHKAHEFTKEALEDSGLSTKPEKGSNTYDRFRDRIMFPIYNRKGNRIIGFGGRAIHGQDPKYLNSPESIVFSKGENLYGLKQASEAIFHAKRVFVVEGYMDVVMVAQYGVRNIVASLGTSVTEEQMKKLFSLCEHITFCMDGDGAGRKAAWRAANNILPLLDERHKVDFMFMPNGMDPDDFVRAEGKAGFESAAAVSRTLTDFVLDVFMRHTDLKNGESLAKYLFTANEMADKIQHGVIKLSFQKRIAELAEISLDTMLQMLKEEREKERPQVAPGTAPAQTEPAKAEVPAPVVPVVAKPAVTAEISVAAKMLGIALLKDKSIAEKLDPEYLGKFLCTYDREMLLPLLAYIKANPVTNDEVLLSTMAFNPHAKLIKSLAVSASLVGEKFDAITEAKAIVDGFRKMERVWQIVNAAKNEADAQSEKVAA